MYKAILLAIIIIVYNICQMRNVTSQSCLAPDSLSISPLGVQIHTGHMGSFCP